MRFCATAELQTCVQLTGGMYIITFCSCMWMYGDLRPAAMSSELCIESKQPEHPNRLRSASSATGGQHQNNSVHESGGVARTDEWPLEPRWPRSGSRAGAGALQMVPFQLRKTLRLALHSLSDMPG